MRNILLKQKINYRLLKVDDHNPKKLVYPIYYRVPLELHPQEGFF